MSVVKHWLNVNWKKRQLAKDTSSIENVSTYITGLEPAIHARTASCATCRRRGCHDYQRGPTPQPRLDAGAAAAAPAVDLENAAPAEVVLQVDALAFFFFHFFLQPAGCSTHGKHTLKCLVRFLCLRVSYYVRPSGTEKRAGSFPFLKSYDGIIVFAAGHDFMKITREIRLTTIKQSWEFNCVILSTSRASSSFFVSPRFFNHQLHASFACSSISNIFAIKSRFENLALCRIPGSGQSNLAPSRFSAKTTKTKAK